MITQGTIIGHESEFKFTMEESLESIKKEIELIKERNARVETDKAWEISTARVTFISLITYLVATAVLYLIGVKNFYYSALIPTIGYLLSTRSLPAIKAWWIKTFYKNR
ncbi:MAG: hypothetical protein V1846_01060 [Candidatus Komeilibacteria bacterium]